MKRAHFAELMRTAAERGLVAQGAIHPPAPVRPWPVVLLTGAGAWIAALLLVAASVALDIGLERAPAAYIAGALALSTAVAILRAARMALFVEQLALPILLLGVVLIGIGWFGGRAAAMPAMLLLVLCLAVAAAVPQPWLRALLGAAAAGLLILACCTKHDFQGHDLWVAVYAPVLLWLASHGLRHGMLTDGRRAPAAAMVEAVAAGWGVAAVVWLACLSGISRFAMADVGHDGLWPALSAVLALAAAASAGVAWPGLRHWPWPLVAAVLAALAWCIPTLGAVLGVLAFGVCSGRRLTACCAALAAAWMVGAWYYQRDWWLADKALVLVAAGAALVALAWLGLRAPQPSTCAPGASPPPAAGARWGRAGIAAGALLVLAVVNCGIWQTETLIAHGQPVFVALAPVDPRSLMQGDYMRLNFAGLAKGTRSLDGDAGAARPLAVFSRDARGVATLVRLHEHQALAAGELLIELTPRRGGWTLVSDAWFFKEGEGGRWARARYGEFRVGADGRALLVGLRGEQLEPL